MRIDLTHNRIVRETMTDRFRAEAERDLIPMLKERFGERIAAVQMYEDYLALGLREGDDAYYPLTVVLENSLPETVWVKWSMARSEDFAGGIPYAYTGDSPLRFSFATEGPILSKMKEKVAGRQIYCEEGILPLEISYPGASPLFLSDKISQTFLDEIARRVTEQIESACGVEGVAESGTALKLVFSAETFLEHINENVTYRRFQLYAKGCAPRDFWIKWTHNGASGPVFLADHPQAWEVEIELGEDVPRKMREKEFRYLAMTDGAKYATSTSKKSVTEWRELIRRAIKRGLVRKVEAEPVADRDQSDIQSELQALLRKYAPAEGSPVGETKPEPVPAYTGAQEPPAAEEKAAGVPKEELPWTEDRATMGEPVEEPAVGEPDEERIRADVEAKLRLEMEQKYRKKAEEDAEALRRENERLQREILLAKKQNDEEAHRLRIEAEERAKADAREKERIAEAARYAIAERDRLRKVYEEEERRKQEALRAEQEARAEEERRRREEEERIRENERLAAERADIRQRAEEERRRAEREARIRSGFGGGYETTAPAPAAEEKAPEVKEEPAPAVRYTYVSHLAELSFSRPVDPNITKHIRAGIDRSLRAFRKENLYMRVQALIKDQNTVLLNFIEFPEQEEELLIKLLNDLGRGGLGIAKIKLD